MESHFRAKEQTKPHKRFEKCYATRATMARFYAKEQKMALRRYKNAKAH
jgi:hypothetical protein